MRLLVPILIATLSLHAQVVPRMAEVQERRLANGARLLLVERRGLSAFHASLVFRGGWAGEPAAAAGATELLAKALYGSTWPEDVDPSRAQPGLDALLRQEEALLEAARLERLRLRRDPVGLSQLPSLEARLEALRAQMKPQLSASPLADLYALRGGRQAAEAGADALVAETELPQEAFEFWCRTEAHRLQRLQLSRFSPSREALVARLRGQGPQGLALLRGAALPGHPYGRDLADHLSALEALRWSDLRAQARRALDPSRLTIILVGGLSLEGALPLLERHLGALPSAPDREEEVLPEIPADLGDRRVQAAVGTAPQLLVGWRIPAQNHPDHLALRLIAQLLGGGQASRLPTRLVRQRGLLSRVELNLDVPGGRLPGLLVADLRPAEGHSLAEAEGGLHGEVLRLQQDLISPEEWQRALAQLEAEYLRRTDEPASLARLLGGAWAEGGDWRQAGQEVQGLRALSPEAVQTVARAWLNPSHRTTVLLEPTLGAGADPLDRDMTRVLTALAALRIQDPAQRERMVTEGVRQLRMLAPEERHRTLKLLEAQLGPEKR